MVQAFCRELQRQWSIGHRRQSGQMLRCCIWCSPPPASKGTHNRQQGTGQGWPIYVLAQIWQKVEPDQLLLPDHISLVKQRQQAYLKKTEAIGLLLRFATGCRGTHTCLASRGRSYVAKMVDDFPTDSTRTIPRGQLKQQSKLAR